MPPTLLLSKNRGHGPLSTKGKSNRGHGPLSTKSEGG